MKINLNKKAAIELSTGTIVIIVLGVTMLILGMVLVRSVMCSAIGLTGEINSKAANELNKYFGQSDAEFVCIGSTTTGPAKLIANGQVSNVICTFKPSEATNYKFSVTSTKSLITSLTDVNLAKWVKSVTPPTAVAPGNTNPTSVARIVIPKDAPEGRIVVTIKIEKQDGTLVGEEQLDYDITRIGLIKSAIC